MSSNQKHLILQNHFELDDSYIFFKAIFCECQMSCKFEYFYTIFVYSMSDDAVYCNDYVVSLSNEKQKRNKGPLILLSKMVPLHKK